MYPVCALCSVPAWIQETKSKRPAYGQPIPNNPQCTLPPAPSYHGGHPASTNTQGDASVSPQHPIIYPHNTRNSPPNVRSAGSTESVRVVLRHPSSTRRNSCPRVPHLDEQDADTHIIPSTGSPQANQPAAAADLKPTGGGEGGGRGRGGGGGGKVAGPCRRAVTSNTGISYRQV